MIISHCRSSSMESSNKKVISWLLELATYNTTFEWISGACNKAVDCLSLLVDVPENDTTDFSILINVVTPSSTDRSTTHTCSKTNAPVMVPSDNTKVNNPQSLMMDYRDSLIQMQWMDPFCKCIPR